MKSVAFAILLLAGCVPDVDQYDVVPSSNSPVLTHAHEAPPTAPDAGTGIADAGIADGGGLGEGFDAMPTAFDAGGSPTDVGSPPADAGVPPNP